MTEDQLGGQKDLEGKVVLLAIVDVPGWSFLLASRGGSGWLLGTIPIAPSVKGRVWDGGNWEGFLLLFPHR